jgi:hypothetical protein
VTLEKFLNSILFLFPKMDDLTYTSAMVQFPEWVKKARTLNRSEMPLIINGNELRFMYGDFLVEARISPHNIPNGLSQSDIIQSEIIKPSIGLITADLKTIEGSLDTLRELAKDGVMQSTLHYRNYSLYCDVIDYSISPTDLFLRLHLLKDQYSGEVANISKDLLEVPLINSEPIVTSSFIRKSKLSVAVEKAITVYRSSKAINDLYAEKFGTTEVVKEEIRI